MEPSAAPDPATSAGPSADDWTDQVTELIVTAVDNVRRSTVEPVRTATKAIIWGALGIGFALPALAIALIAGFHLLVQIFNAATPGPDDNAWMAWYLLGIGAVVGGLVLFGRRNATDRG